MFKKTKCESLLDNEIERTLNSLSYYDPDTEKYKSIVDQLKALHRMKDAEMQSSRVKPDTVILSGVNLLGIFMIIKHENVNVITSKAMSFVPKLR